MTQITYFAYGSNMLLSRLQSRVPSASKIGTAVLDHHKLTFHKISKKDGSGKCDIVKSEADSVLGVLFSIEYAELDTLDKFEGHGNGYNREMVDVLSQTGDVIKAATYRATRIDPTLCPYTWYKRHVLEGAISAELPTEYIQKIESVAANKDPDTNREAIELAIYS